MAMFRRFWEDALGEEVRSILSIGSANEAKEIIEDFLIPDKIDPLRFRCNCEALLLRGMPSGATELLGLKKSHEPTQSVSEFTSVLDRPSFVPLWFIAGYPDVLLWHKNELREYKITHGRDEDGLDVFNAKLFGIDLTDPDLERMDEFVDGKGNPSPKSLRNLVRSYKERTGKELETTIEKYEDGIWDDLASGF